MNWFERHLGGHLSFKLLGHRITIYGFNAMHVAINIHTRRWGYICFHPPMPRWPWYLYASPNATPWAASWGIGPGIEREEKNRIKHRRWTDVYRRMQPIWNASFHIGHSLDDPYWKGVRDGLRLAIEELMERRQYDHDLKLVEVDGEDTVEIKEKVND